MAGRVPYGPFLIVGLREPQCCDVGVERRDVFVGRSAAKSEKFRGSLPERSEGGTWSLLFGDRQTHLQQCARERHGYSSERAAAGGRRVTGDAVFELLKSQIPNGGRSQSALLCLAFEKDRSPLAKLARCRAG